MAPLLSFAGGTDGCRFPLFLELTPTVAAFQDWRHWSDRRRSPLPPSPVATLIPRHSLDLDPVHGTRGRPRARHVVEDAQRERRTERGPRVARREEWSGTEGRPRKRLLVPDLDERE